MTLRKLYVLMLFSLLNCIGYCALELYEDGEIVEGDDYAFVYVYSDSKADMLGGEVGWLRAHDNSTVSIYAGSIGNLTALQEATFNLYGGQIRQGFYGLHDTAQLHVYGYDFSTYIENGRIFLAGKWQDESTFKLYFHRELELPDSVTLHEIPEPATALLLLSGLLINTFRRRNL